MGTETFGRIAFYVGLVIAIVAGWIQVQALWLVLLGLVVGLLNVTAKETGRFLLATLALVVAGVALQSVIGDLVGRMLGAYIAFTAAAALVVALKEVYSMQKTR